MAAEGDAIVTFIYNGQDRADIPQNITHLIIDESITVIPTLLFLGRPNLVEVYCHAGVIIIEEAAFYYCQSLRRVIIPGVIVVGEDVFFDCNNLVFIECGKLERVGIHAFSGCKSLTSINLPSAITVEIGAFFDCPAMIEATFGKDLESIGLGALSYCKSLGSVTIPLKNGLLGEDDLNIFAMCVNLKRVNLVEDEALRDISDALLLESWRDNLNEALDSINQTLPNVAARSVHDGGKTIAIRGWIRSVRRKIMHYKVAHRELLNVAAAVLQLSLPNDTVMNNVLPFLELPAHTFDGEDEAE